MHITKASGSKSSPTHPLHSASLVRCQNIFKLRILNKQEVNMAVIPVREMKNRFIEMGFGVDSDLTAPAGADPGMALCRRRLSLSQQGVLSHLVQGWLEVGV